MLKGAHNWSWNENALILGNYLILRTEHANRMQDEHWCLQQFLATVLFFIKVAVGGGSGGGGKGLGATWHMKLGDMDYFFMHNESFSRPNEFRTWVNNGSSSKFVKSMGYVIKRAIFVMHEKYFLKYSYTFSRCKC